jgi:protein phosphatase
MRFVWATGTHRGLIREANEDSVHPEADGAGPGPVFVAVADGMGGHAAGEVASRVALSTALGREGSMIERFVAANEAVVKASVEDPKLAGMGTTLTLAAIRPDGSTTIGHVGDSRAYLLRRGLLHQLTEDHTLVAQWISEGRLSPEEAAIHPQRSMLMRAVGHGRPLDVDVIEERLSPGDRLMLCSDGLSGMINDDRLRELLGAATAEEAVWALIEAANQAGGHDNISVVVVDTQP